MQQCRIGAEKMRKVITKILAILIIIQPFLNLHIIVNNTSLTFAGVHITTIIRYGIIGVLGLYIIFSGKFKDNRKIMLLYGILIVIYLFGHHINAQDFYTLVRNGIDYSFFEELLYIIRYLVPTFLMYFICVDGLERELFNKVLIVFSLIMSLSVIVTNILYLSYSSYMDIRILQNIFDWFNQTASYVYASSRGLFYSSIVIPVLMLITPYLFSRYYKTEKKIYIVTVILNLLTLIMCGTKACTFGAVIISTIMFGMYIFFSIIKKEFRFKKMNFVIAAALVILPISILDKTPAFSRIEVTKELTEQSVEIEEEIQAEEKIYTEFINIDSVKDSKKRRKIITNFFEENINYIGIQKEFITEKYPYTDDYEFWNYIYRNNTRYQRQDNRHIEEEMLKRIKSVNNKPYDNLFGLTYSRTSKVYNLESDFRYQYYSLGIAGEILFMGPMITTLIIGIILTLTRNFTIENTSLCFGIALLYATAYTSGNILDNLSILILLGFTTGYLLYGLKKRKKVRGNKNMKFTIIMPTYNDCESIKETLDSIINQKYDNWELLISDDGSTDDTKKFVKNYIKEHNEDRIKYFYQTNQDQLNAILNVLDKATGDYVYILHSDDMFVDKNILKKVNNDLKVEPSDILFANNLITIDGKSKVSGTLKYPEYKNKEYIMPLQLLWLGRQLYTDFAFHKLEVFKKYVKYNYLTWNTPFWLNFDGEPFMLNVRTVDYPVFKYRVFEGNYINNEIGKLNVINGELRTAIHLLKYYNIPNYKLQYLLFRTFNKLGLRDLYRPIYQKQESKNKADIVKFIIGKRYKNEELKKYPHLTSLIKFFENYQDRKIEIKEISKEEIIYQGKDMRAFNKRIVNNEISKLYTTIFKEMEKGFNVIETTEECEEKVNDIVKFLNMYPFVEVKVVDNKKKTKKK